FLELPRLARALELPGKANLLLAAASAGPSGNLKEALAGALEAGDFGLIVKPAGQQVVVESRELVLSDALAERLEAILAGLGVSPSGVLTYLANRLEVGDKALPYSTLAGLELPAGGSPALRLVSGAPAPPLAPGEIYLNRWAAEELSASPGATVRVSSYRLGPRDELAEEQHEWRLAGVVELAGLGADPSLTPNLPGVSDALNMADWQPPFPVDLGRIRPRDEAYWHAHRAAPKAFVALSEAQALWRSRYGALTSLRLDPPAGTSAQDFAARLRQELAHRLEPAAFGLSFEPLRQRLLAGSAGATDFAQLFLAFSFFLILSAALLTGLLFRLGVEQRAREVGLLAALGYPAARIRRRFLAEGLVLALAGGLLGVVAALGYARLLLLGLATWWLPAVGTSELTLHVAPGSLVVGGLASVAMMALAVALPWLSPIKFKIEPFRPTYDYIMMLVVALFFYMHVVITSAYMGLLTDVGQWIVG
ncbi:MAG TPA: hypothetical protein PK413_16395, partial [Thermoanaerobaculia bacterium]|nr:hypothetical protein [Thermoanaerobaculia bacterium]